MDWVKVPAEQAKKHPLYGFGGWMVLIQILLFIALAAHVGLIVIGLYDFFVSSVQRSGTAGTLTYFFLAFMAYSVAMTLLLTLSIVFLYSRIFVVFITFYYIVLAMKAVLMVFLFVRYGGLAVAYFFVVPIDFAFFAATLFYFRFSRRANVTLRRRIRRSDEFWKTVEAAAGRAVGA